MGTVDERESFESDLEGLANTNSITNQDIL